jgi:hypothetical protein
VTYYVGVKALGPDSKASDAGLIAVVGSPGSDELIGEATQVREGGRMCYMIALGPPGSMKTPIPGRFERVAKEFRELPG